VTEVRTGRRKRNRRRMVEMINSRWKMKKAEKNPEAEAGKSGQCKKNVCDDLRADVDADGAGETTNSG